MNILKISHDLEEDIALLSFQKLVINFWKILCIIIWLIIFINHFVAASISACSGEC